MGQGRRPPEHEHPRPLALATRDLRSRAGRRRAPPARRAPAPIARRPRPTTSSATRTATSASVSSGAPPSAAAIASEVAERTLPPPPPAPAPGAARLRHAGAATTSTSSSGAVRERAGLVEADRVDGGERLDGVQLLRERAGARDPHRAGRERDRRQQDEALGDERDEAGRGGLRRPRGSAVSWIRSAATRMTASGTITSSRRRSRRLISSCSVDSALRLARPRP